jgi:hypothetical protein
MKAFSLPYVLPFLLLACGVPSDQHKFEKRERTTSTVLVTVVEYPNAYQLGMALNDLGKVPENIEIDTYAFAELSRDGTSCRIHVVKPEEKHTPHWWGHELLHCHYGRWHS